MEMNGRFALSCEQVESIVLDFYSDGATDPAQRAAALAHVSRCSRCAAVQESWEAAKEELRAWSEETLDAQAPPRVEMRVMQEFRTQHRKVAVRRAGIVTSWALAAAAVAIAAVTWWNAHNAVREPNGNISPVPAANSATTAVPGELVAVLTNGDDAGDFTPLPGAVGGENDEAAILRVRMQRGSLGALGLPVNEQRANEWIQVDLLVGSDGSPEGVRLAQEEN